MKLSTRLRGFGLIAFMLLVTTVITMAAQFLALLVDWYLTWLPQHDFDTFAAINTMCLMALAYAFIAVLLVAAVHVLATIYHDFVTAEEAKGKE